MEGFEAPIVEDQHLDSGNALEDNGIAAIAVRQGEIGEVGDPLIEHRAVVAAGLVAKGAGRPFHFTPTSASWLNAVEGFSPS